VDDPTRRASDELTINDAGAGSDRAEGLPQSGKAMGAVNAMARKQHDVIAILDDLNAPAVEFYLVDPSLAGRRRRCQFRNAWRNERGMYGFHKTSDGGAPPETQA
jgi:hypothetical protein